MDSLSRRLYELNKCQEFGLHTAAAILSVLILEEVLRRFFRQGVSDLETKAEYAARDLEALIGKPSRRATAFSLGELVRLFNESRFFEAWGRANNRDTHDLETFQLNQLNKWRNKLVHEGLNAEKTQSDLLVGFVKNLLRAANLLDEAAAPRPPTPPPPTPPAPVEAPVSPTPPSRLRAATPRPKKPKAATQPAAVIRAIPENRSPPPMIEVPAETDVVRALVSRLRRVEPGSYELKSKAAGPTPVQFSRALYWDPYPVTQELYEAVCLKNPSYSKGPKRPVEQVSWFEAVAFCNQLSRSLGLEPAHSEDGWLNLNAPGFRLPTEAEWEYACAEHAPGDGGLDRIAWYNINSEDETKDVGLRDPNRNQLHDMLGNVWEWCNDWYSDAPGLGGLDPLGPAGGDYRVCRGGSFGNFANAVHAMARQKKGPRFGAKHHGFRIVTRSSLRCTDGK